MIEFLDSLPYLSINLTGFMFLYIGSAVIGSALIMSKGHT
jgi:hypothetical protein